MTTFKTIAEKLLTSKDYKHPDQVNQDIEKLIELYGELQKECDELRATLDRVLSL